MVAMSVSFSLHCIEVWSVEVKNLVANLFQTVTLFNLLMIFIVYVILPGESRGLPGLLKRFIYLLLKFQAVDKHLFDVLSVSNLDCWGFAGKHFNNDIMSLL